MLSNKAIAAAEYVTGVENMPLLQISGVSFREFLLAHRRVPIIAITGQA